VLPTHISSFTDTDTDTGTETVAVKNSVALIGAATIRATQHIINASYNQSQRFFHLNPEPQMS
jgi:hypothetical protein